jgi:hypothetical protein
MISMMVSSTVSFVTSALGVGSSFDEPDMSFDRAFAFFEYSDYTPNMSTMVKLCGRVRSTTHRSLCYAVVMGNRRPRVTTTTTTNPHRGSVDADDTILKRLEAEYHYFKNDPMSTVRSCQDARRMTRDALVGAFSITSKSGRLAPTFETGSFYKQYQHMTAQPKVVITPVDCPDVVQRRKTVVVDCPEVDQKEKMITATKRKRDYPEGPQKKQKKMIQTTLKFPATSSS